MAGTPDFAPTTLCVMAALVSLGADARPPSRNPLRRAQEGRRSHAPPEFRGVPGDAGVKDKIANIGLTPLVSPPPAQLRTYLETEITTWSKFVQQIGLAGSL